MTNLLTPQAAEILQRVFLCAGVDMVRESNGLAHLEFTGDAAMPNGEETFARTVLDLTELIPNGLGNKPSLPDIRGSASQAGTGAASCFSGGYTPCEMRTR